jgi:hypothetical protein
MPDTIKDGASGNVAGVDDENRLKVYSTTEKEISHESETNKRAYTFTHSYDYDAGDTIIWLKNTSSLYNLIIERVGLASDTTTKFISHFPNGTTPAGTEITGTQLNRSSNNSADVQCYGDETGNTQGVIEVQGIIPANTTIILPYDGSVVLGPNDEFAFDFVTAGTLGMATIRAYFHNPL